ncbi:MAG TPA: hypothetical protein VFK85_12455 [Anaeromyxobacteraceae bacterium]|nr:hypothetical protein [Anaeromyxobacteraceae bacterium]
MLSRRLAPWVVLLCCAACFPRASVPDADRQRISRELDGQQRWLAVSLNAGPFYGDTSKLLVAPQPFRELELLEDVDGRPIEPAPAERVIAAGTPVRITRVELPTGWIIARRVVMTPRYHPWAFLEVPGEPRPLILVLRQDASSFDDIHAELDSVLTGTDPAPVLRALTAEQRAAIGRKSVVEGMPPRAVEMAWGQPWKRVLDVPAKKEEWVWVGESRRVWFEDGRLVRWSERGR